MERCVWFRWGI